MSNLPQRTSSYITVLPSTVSQIHNFVDRFIQEMGGGCIEATKVALQLKAMETLIKKLRANPKIRDMIMESVDKETDKVFTIDGARFEKSETGTSYDFSNCGSSTWERLKKEEESLAVDLKAEEEKLKMLYYSDLEIADEETGEILNPPVKTSNSYVKITLIG